jgi:LuxR family transcriptional regulator, maltose regulon positive regulatory protein
MSQNPTTIDTRTPSPSPARRGRLRLVSAEAPPGPTVDRPWLVHRRHLVRRLLDARDARVVLITAGAGYGKTTLLTQWAAADERPFAWVPLEDSDNDPYALVASIDLALGAAELPSWPGGPWPAGSGSSPPTRLARGVTERTGPFALVLDDAHLLRTPGSLGILSAVADHLPPGSQVVLASRVEPDLPLARWRVQRDLLHLGPDELAMTPAEAGALLHAAGLRLDSGDQEALVRQTEGWPAGLSLAVLSAGQSDAEEAAVAGLAGSDPMVAEYLRTQVLDGLAPREARFLRRTSIAERLSADLCDALLQRADSGAVLAHLERSNAFLIPVDRRQGWYRHHPLFRDLLREELDRHEPLLRPELHRRASAWHERHGCRTDAIRHAQAAGDVERAGHLVWAGLPAMLDAGSPRELRRHLDAFSASQTAAQPALSMAAAWCHLHEGDVASAELWARTAERGLERRPAPGPSSVRSGAGALRALIARQGVTRMGEDAAAGLAEGDAGARWSPVCCLLVGVAGRLRGGADRAWDHLEEAERLALVHEAPALAAASQAQLALLAVAGEDWEQASRAVDRARATLARARLSDHPWLAEVYATASLVLAHQGRAAEAHESIRQATRLLGAPAYTPPWMAMEARLLLARADLLLGDAASARDLLSEVTRLMGRTPDVGLLGAELDAARRLADAFRAAGIPGTSVLSRAELRILAFLPTHLSYREIADQLHLSQCTVKTQVLAAFRKLDVSSRSEAVQRAGALGLIPR